MILVRFTVTGTIDLGRKTQPFEKDVEADSEEHALDVVYSSFGSKHRISRSNIEIDEIEEQ